MKVLSDNTKATYYTKCKKCGSELEYKYEDVKFEEIPYSNIPMRTVICPCCNHVTVSELTSKDSYQDFSLPLLPSVFPDFFKQDK